MSGSGIARAVCWIQVVIASCVAAVAAMGWGWQYALAALFGGAAAFIPTVYFAFRVFAQRAKRTPDQVVGAIFRGEIGKFALTAVMFAFGVKLFAPQFPALLAAYVMCLLAYWAVMGIMMVRSGSSGTDKTL